jgi:hypothetical protein
MLCVTPVPRGSCSRGLICYRVRDLLRHKSVQMTERYTHLAPHNVRSAVETLDEISVPGPAGP